MLNQTCKGTRSFERGGLGALQCQRGLAATVALKAAWDEFCKTFKEHLPVYPTLTLHFLHGPTTQKGSITARPPYFWIQLEDAQSTENSVPNKG